MLATRTEVALLITTFALIALTSISGASAFQVPAPVTAEPAEPEAAEPADADLASETLLERLAPNEDARALQNIDLEGAGTTFRLLGDMEGTSIIVKVKNAQGDNIAVIKTDTSNTSTEGEVFVYRLAQLLGFEDIVAPVVPVELGAGALTKLRATLADRSYPDANKERRRVRLIARIDELISTGGSLPGAIKPWLSAFMFTTSVGRRESLAGHEIMRFLRARGPQPEVGDIEISQFTRIYEPYGTHRGIIDRAQLAYDVSNMMLVDALSGQNDRFAGANVHIRSVAGEREEIGERRGLPIYHMGQVRVLLLDNGATLSGRHGTGLADLMGNQLEGTRVERFSREAVEQLRELACVGLEEVRCEAQSDDVDPESVWEALGIRTASHRGYAQSYLRDTLEYIDALHARYGDGIYFDRAEGE